MIIDRKTILAVILADFFVMFGAGFIMWDRVQLAEAQVTAVPAHETVSQSLAATNPGPTSTPVDLNPPLEPVAPSAGSPSAAQGNAPAQTPAAQPQASAPTRRIRFSYRNSKPQRVEIIGDFNNWQPQPMTHGKNFEWYSTFPLRPGEYTYNFIVDGKVIRDPNNARTASEGRSLLTVKPLTE